jgi:hypothetical protein
MDRASLSIDPESDSNAVMPRPALSGSSSRPPEGRCREDRRHAEQDQVRQRYANEITEIKGAERAQTPWL